MDIATSEKFPDALGERKYYDKVLSLALDLAGGLLMCGAAVSRVEIAVQRICLAYGAAEVNVFSFPSIVEASVKLADGSEASQMKRVSGMGNNFYKLELINQLSRDICNKKMPVDEAREKLDALLKDPCSKTPISVAGGGVAAGAFTVLFGGSYVDAILAFFIGMGMCYLNTLLSRRDFNAYARTFLLSVIGGVLSITFTYLLSLCGADCNSSMVIIGTIMVVIPGLLVCNAIRDMFAGDLFSGTFELINGILIAISVVGGYALSSVILKGITVAHAPIKLEGALYYVVSMLICILGSTGFSFMFHCNFKKVPLCIINIVVTFALYLLMEAFVDNMFTNYFVASVLSAIVAEVFARVFKAPSTIFLVPAIIVFVPGRQLYYSLAALATGDGATAMQWITEAGIIFLAIAVALIFVTTLFQLIHPQKKFLFRHRNDKGKEN